MKIPDWKVLALGAGVGLLGWNAWRSKERADLRMLLMGDLPTRILLRDIDGTIAAALPWGSTKTADVAFREIQTMIRGQLTDVNKLSEGAKQLLSMIGKKKPVAETGGGTPEVKPASPTSGMGVMDGLAVAYGPPQAPHPRPNPILVPQEEAGPLTPQVMPKVPPAPALAPRPAAQPQQERDVFGELVSFEDWAAKFPR